jgi:phosphatidylglycerophosphate synthase
MPWHLPHPPLRGRGLSAQLLGLAAAALSAWLVGAVMPTSSGYPLKAAAVFAGIAVVSLGYLRDNHPFDRFGSGNAVTTLRAALLAVVAASIGEVAGEAMAWTAAVLGIGITALDGVDGWLARRTGMTSAFGARYDMELDALLIAVLGILAWRHGKAGVWIVLAGGMRYLFLGAGYVWRWLESPLPPSDRRKAACVVQIVGLIVVMSPVVSPPASVAIAALTLAGLTWSFAVDVLWLRRHRA